VRLPMRFAYWRRTQGGDARNQVAIRRGPVVYCLEGVDLPADWRWLTWACRATCSSFPGMSRNY